MAKNQDLRFEADRFPPFEADSSVWFSPVSPCDLMR